MSRARNIQLSLLVCGLFICGSSASWATNVWWSLRPVIRPAIPKVEKFSAANPIDFFLLSTLERHGLDFSPAADRRTLIRRVYYDLTGLPPSPEEVQRFVQNSDPKAYELLVDQLLASPRYGERWARHWLDVVHYGDTHGYDKDQPRPNAWTYRDYVIRAFNGDKPYARFIEEQLAGDVVAPNEAEALLALGFISAGPWDLIGHAELPETKIDGKIARHLDRDDMVANTMSSFTSMTVHCAQCHDHKFDPISAEDYYSLQAVFAAVDRTNVEYYDDTELNKIRSSLKERERKLIREKKATEESIEKLGGAELVELRKELERSKKLNGGKRPAEYGYHSQIAAAADTPKWVQIDLGSETSLRQIALVPCWDDFAGIGDGFGFPVRFKIEVSSNEEFETGVVVHDQLSADFKNPGLLNQSFDTKANGRFVRVTATRLAPRQNDYIFALAELQAFDATGTNVARGATVTALDSIEAPVRWAKKNLTDGIVPNGGADLSKVAALERRMADLLEIQVDSETRSKWSEITNNLSVVQAELGAMPKPKLAFVGAVHHGSGSFRGTGPDGGKPRAIHLLARGDVKKPGRPVAPGALSAMDFSPPRFEGRETDSERRLALARWITHPDNPLTWRSIVNRVWQYHFGRGLVETPNDFGRMGAQPSHPELLDWLAAEFRDGGQSLKQLHKLIVTSAAYRQVSSSDPENPAIKIDHDNRLLWRMNRRKIEAEALRDSVLAVSGRLDLTMFGPGFQDFIIEKPEHSPHYQYHLHDPEDPETQRRSIYRFIVRSQQQPFMTTLDCADPSMMVEKRNESVSSLQALALLNNGFIVNAAKHFAARLERETDTPDRQVEKAFWLALGRAPTTVEQKNLTAFAQRNGLPNMCRLILNLNEFAFVD